MEPYLFQLKPNARTLRNTMTKAEHILWSRLRRKQLLDLQFYRQKPILTYIVDFYCPKAKLVIELDGSQHYEVEHIEADKIRDQTLNSLGLYVLRFNNREVISSIENVIAHITQIIEKRI